MPYHNDIQTDLRVADLWQIREMWQIRGRFQVNSLEFGPCHTKFRQPLPHAASSFLAHDKWISHTWEIVFSFVRKHDYLKRSRNSRDLNQLNYHLFEPVGAEFGNNSFAWCELWEQCPTPVKKYRIDMRKVGTFMTTTVLFYASRCGLWELFRVYWAIFMPLGADFANILGSF